MEHGDLFGARRAEILFEQRATFRVQIATFARHHALGVRLRLRGRIDAADLEVIDDARDRLCDVRRRIGRAQVHVDASRRELDRDSRRHRRLSDATFAHHHDEAVPGTGELVDQARQRR